GFLRRRGCCRRGRGRGLGRRHGGRGRAGTLGVAMREMRRDGGHGDVDRVRAAVAGHVADVDLLLAGAGAFRFAGGRARQLLRRRARGQTARGRGRLLVAVRLLEPAVVGLLVPVVLADVFVAGRARLHTRRLRRAADGRRSGRGLRGDLGEADAGGCREGEPDDHSNEGTPAESAESFVHAPQSPAESETCAALTSRPTCSSPNTKGGRILRTSPFGPVRPIRIPASRSRSTVRAASSTVASWTPTSRPRPRTSTISGRSSSRRAASSCPPTFAARPIRRSSSTTSSTASAACAATGLPPNVLNTSPANGNRSTSSRRVTRAATG